MQITLKQFHIEAALRDYVVKAGISFPVDEINFTAGRGEAGLTATVQLEDPFLAAEMAHEASQADEPADKGIVPPKPRARRTVAQVADSTADPVEPEPVEEQAAVAPTNVFGAQEPPFEKDEDAPEAVAPAAPTPVERGVSLFG